MYKSLVAIVFILFFCSCKTVWLGTEPYKKTDSSIVLNYIVTEKQKSIQRKTFVSAIPKLKHSLPITAIIKNFNNQIFNAFKDANHYQDKTVHIVYHDSLKLKPQCIVLQIADEVKQIEELYSQENKLIIQHLQNNPSSKIVTEMLVYLPKNLTENVMNAESVFLEQKAYKTYQIGIYKNGKKTLSIPLSDALIFGYKTSGFCWTQNKRKDWVIGGINRFDEVCSHNQYSSYIKAIKNTKTNDFKFF